MFNKYNLGSTYSKGFIDVTEEKIPATPGFRAFPDEEHIYLSEAKPLPYRMLENDLKRGIITEFDKKVLCLIAVFGSSACTSKAIFELLTLMGEKTTRDKIDSSVKRLNRYQLIDFSRFKSSDGSFSNTKIITLRIPGFKLAKQLGINTRFNPQENPVSPPSTIKSRVESTQLICNWLKNLPVESFEVRPLRLIKGVDGAIVRPAASITLWGDTVYFEVPRKFGDWKEGLIEKLKRYEAVFGKDSLPLTVINGEDAEMNLELHKFLKEKGIRHPILYTDDIAMFGKNFESSLYSFDEENRLIRYRIKK